MRQETNVWKLLVERSYDKCGGVLCKQGFLSPCSCKRWARDVAKFNKETNRQNDYKKAIEWR